MVLPYGAYMYMLLDIICQLLHEMTLWPIYGNIYIYIIVYIRHIVYGAHADIIYGVLITHPVQASSSLHVKAAEI